ncbi:hypothetical protein EVAR_17502_1 [Eumeta japonica]|uniref:Uncharacterized protein n=1 Tax=Eumeta variegata TaxID=151549 RepID=A0A4C1WTH2_EUMVA|nr:hypothetical protein EVAR_17502_1 [Eumeta japonica]
MKHYHERFNHGNHNTVMNEISRNIISRRCDRNYEKSPTNVNGAELTEVCRKCRLRRVTCLPNAYVITNPFTYSMILALRRFIARRGTPSDVFGQRHEFRRRKQRTDEHTRGTREMKKEADVRTIT